MPAVQVGNRATGLGLLEHGQNLTIGEARLFYRNLFGKSYEKIPPLPAWQVGGKRAIPLLVSVSSVQFQRPEFADEIEDTLRQPGIAPALLKVEITESAVMVDAKTGVMVLKRLRELGVRVSLADFGTGYSSLGYLRQLPLDEIKIDKSFVRDVVEDSYVATLRRAIIPMSQQLGLIVVAEGVETEAQAHFLKEAGCQLLQGFLFSTPVPANQLGEWVLHDTRWLLNDRQVNQPSQ